LDERDMGADLKQVLITAEQLHARIGELAAQIDADYAGRDLLLIGVLKGAVMVMADLARAMHLPVQMDWMAISSYGSGTKSSGVVRILKDLDTDITGRHVLIVEDIVDSGLTLSWLAGNLRSRAPASLAVCAMLRKPGSAQMHVDVAYTGFDIGDEFVVATCHSSGRSPRRCTGAVRLRQTGEHNLPREALTFQALHRNRCTVTVSRLAAAPGTLAARMRAGHPGGGRRDVRLVRRERPRADGAAHRWS